MGYFSNGSEGDMYEAQYCANCLHDENNDCPVLLAHLLFNYDQCKNEAYAKVLNIFIPQTKDGCGNEKCTMFVPRPPKQFDLFEEIGG